VWGDFSWLWSGLAHLPHLQGLLIRESGLQTLQGLGLPHLSKLDLSYNQLADTALDALLNCPALESLSLAHNPLDSTARLALLLPRLTRLKRLSLASCGLSDTLALPAVAVVHRCPRLRQVELQDNAVAPSVRQTLAAALQLERIPEREKTPQRSALVPRKGREKLSVEELAAKWQVEVIWPESKAGKQIEELREDNNTLLTLYNQLLSEHAEVCLAYDAAIDKAKEVPLPSLASVKARANKDPVNFSPKK
jgi:hypothetical protein